MRSRTRNPIARYRKDHKLLWREVAQRLGLGYGYARKLGCGARVAVSPAKALEIERRSGGEIRAEELVFGDRKRRRAS